MEYYKINILLVNKV